MIVAIIILAMLSIMLALGLIVTAFDCYDAQQSAAFWERESNYLRMIYGEASRELHQLRTRIAVLEDGDEEG